MRREGREGTKGKEGVGSDEYQKKNVVTDAENHAWSFPALRAGSQ